MTDTEHTPKFAVGDVVKHRRYAYRGVIVGFDEAFMGTDEWYHNNPTQPNREQPWYHVLVHGSAHSTYAAEENLVADTSGEQIVHPLVKSFFAGFQNARYVEV